MPIVVATPRRLGPAGAALLIAAVGVGVARLAADAPAPPPVEPVRLATFNIEEFPKDAAQIDGAFALIAGLDAEVVAVQEIFDADAFIAAAHRWLGPTWTFAHADTMPVGGRWPPVHVGVLFDARAFEEVGAIVHDELRLDGRQKPALEVQLRPRRGGPLLRVFVVHLKSGSANREVRARQLAALGDVLHAAQRAPGRIAVLGDFNATDEDDRADLAALARATGLAWATEALPCSAFWRRDDDCPTSRLDHALTWAPPTAVETHGACASAGCGDHASCPRYRDEISDHCPITIDLE
jgi:exonuclease III